MTARTGLVVYAISIHAPLVGGDDKFRVKLIFPQISIHAPLVGGDP